MIKYRLYYDKDDEQKWLNKMAQKGYAAIKYWMGFYTFEACEPGEYIYQSDLLEDKRGAFDSYKSFMSEVGVEVVIHWNRWVIVRKKAADGPFELYTDTASRAEQYGRIRKMFLPVSILEICIALLELINYFSVRRPIFLVFAILLFVIGIAMIRMQIACRRKEKEV